MKQSPELTPDIILVDGNGILHTHRFGLASHLGVIVDIPTIGVAKNLFQMNDLGLLRDDEHKSKIDQLEKVGDSFDLCGEENQVLGLALKNCAATSKPVFVSIGHKVSLERAKKVVLQCSKFRVPEPVRQADMRSREFIRCSAAKAEALSLS